MASTTLGLDQATMKNATEGGDVLFMLKSLTDQRIFPLLSGKLFLIGREPECDLYLEMDGVSRRHAAIACRDAVCAVKDLNSANGTYLNGKVIAKPTTLKNGDIIVIASEKFQIVTQSAENATTPKNTEPVEEDKSSKRNSTSLRLPRAMLLDSKGETDMRRALDSVPPYSPKNTICDTTRILSPGEGKETFPKTAHEESLPKRDELQELVSSSVFEDSIPRLDGQNLETMRGNDTVIYKKSPLTEPLEELPITPELRSAIDDRMLLYGALSDMNGERSLLRSGQPNMSADVAAELARQDREATVLPASESIAANLAALRKQTPYTAAAAHRLEAKVRQLAELQWETIQASNADSLPKICAETGKITESEPLQLGLKAVGLEASELLNMAHYYLALEAMEREFAAALSSVKDMLTKKANDARKKSSISERLFRFAETVRIVKAPKHEDTDLAMRRDALVERLDSIRREKGFLERELIGLFWKAYRRITLHFIASRGEIPCAVRAFIRFGVISLHPRWMKRELAAQITAECAKAFSFADLPGKATRVLYADEYLTSVIKNQCLPTPEKNTSSQNKISLAYKSDKAFRKAISARMYCGNLMALIQDTNAVIAELKEEEKAITSSMSTLGSKDGSAAAHTLHALQTRCSVLQKFVADVENGELKNLRKNVADIEAKVKTGELLFPSATDLLTKECDKIIASSRLMSHGHERFLPLAWRDEINPEFQFDTLNTREEVAMTLSGLEIRDPGIFTQTLLASRRKKHRIVLRTSPLVVILPSHATQGQLGHYKDGYDCGCLMAPTSFSHANLRERQFIYLLADYRWETSRKESGLDILKSPTIAGAFTRLRWEWRDYPKPKREKGLVFREQSDSVNWRKVYEFYIQDALEGGRKLRARNPQCFANVIAKYLLPPDGVLWQFGGTQD